MKKLLKIPNRLGYCKNCFNERRHGSAYCGKENCGKKLDIFTDTLFNFPLLKETINKFKLSQEQVFKTIFTYGDTIYSLNDLSFGLIAHEITHVFQQTEMGAEKWWDKYFKDKDFRLSQEVEAYRRQYQVYKNNNEVTAYDYLNQMARDLSSKMYGEIISFEEAKKLISNK